jgi:Rrf2 family protein
MKVSTRGRYATCALICLAENYGKTPLSLKKISMNQKISVKYLENIMRLFLASGIVLSTKGKSGGFLLGKDPKQIKMGEVVRIAEGNVLPVHCVENSDLCPRKNTCAAKYMWKELKDVIMDKLNGTSLYDLTQHKKMLEKKRNT